MWMAYGQTSRNLDQWRALNCRFYNGDDLDLAVNLSKLRNSLKFIGARARGV
jgi:hypothetical protein